jgi:hypothetical protein
MNYNINVTISDFERFIEFNESEKPILSVKLGVFGKKDCLKLNMLLENKKEVSAPNYNQDQYPAIDLMFSLALFSKLYIRANDEKGKLKLIKTPNIESFQSLNEYEKYVFLLQTYWTKYDFEKKFDRWINIAAFYNIIADIANAEEGQRIVKKEEYGLDTMYSEGASFLHHLKFFGFGEMELIDGIKSKYEDSIRSFSPNAFGIKISKFLLSKALIYWNREDLNLLLAVMKIKITSNRKEEYFDVFKNLFQEKLVKNTVQNKCAIDGSGVYSFKVSLSKKIWRKISLSHKHTLGDLHNAIQEAFCFDNDHLYAFYIDGNQRTGKPIYCKGMEKGENTSDNTSIYSLELYKGQKMLYLFDFGDEWKFDVELMEITKETSIPLKPVIVESKGKAPEQYYGGEW